MNVDEVECAHVGRYLSYPQPTAFNGDADEELGLPGTCRAEKTHCFPSYPLAEGTALGKELINW